MYITQSVVLYIYRNNRSHIGCTETVVVGYLFKEQETFFDGPPRRQRKLPARVASHVRRRSLDFSSIVGRPTHWLTFFARRSTLVARALGETRIGWTRRGYGWRDATGRDATFFSLLLSCRRYSSNRGREGRDKRTKGWTRYCVVSERRPAELSRVNARGRLKKKRGRASPLSGFILPRVHHVEKRTKPA